MIARRLSLLFALAFLASVGACQSTKTSPASARQMHSSTIAVSPDGARLFVVHPDADSVSVLDTKTHAIVSEILLAASAPAEDPASHRFDPSVGPRALALDPAGAHLYVTGQRSGQLYAIDASSFAVQGKVAVCAEPIGALVSAGGDKIYVACSQDDAVVEVDAASLAISGTVATPRRPWSLAWGEGGQTLFTSHLLGPGVSTLATHPLSLTKTWTVADRGPETDPTEPHGVVRGIYDVMQRPGTDELWTLHMMLGIDTPQPTLAFNNTVFPAVAILDGTGTELARLSVQASTTNPGDNGAFGDVVSGPRSMAFSDDGAFAFVVDADSEDLLVIDAQKRIEATLVRPLPGHLPEGAVWFGNKLYLQERNTEDIVAFDVSVQGGRVEVTQDGAPWKSLGTDPMPANLRLGQKLFYSANSDDVPTTQNHWVACATCHVEGRSDAVTWLFEQGPRDTPTNAGGMLDTGFLFRTGDRSKVQDYWKTIDVEQGGHFGPGAQEPLLDALAAYVNYAIPAPIPPTTDATERAAGQAVFERAGCTNCHAGPAKTDSGMGNPMLDLGGQVTLHDVGTCVKSGPWPDVAHSAMDGKPRAACAFDTPALRGVWDSAPYMHDGSAATLDDAVTVMLRAAQASPLSASDRAALIAYLKSL